MFYKRPALITTEDYIYDVVADIKYSRQDIEEIYEKNAYLYITLNAPMAYLNKIGDPVKRLIANIDYEPDSKETSYKINLDLIDIDQDTLWEILDDYDIKTIATENLNVKDSITYGLKWGRNFWSWLFGMLVGLIAIIFNLFGHYKDYVIGSIYLFLIIIIVLPRLNKLCYFWIKKKPTLSVNESFIFDQYDDVKYYWKDIAEIIASEDLLQIKLYEPEKYIDKVKNPFRRFIKQIWYKHFNKNPSYSINLDMVDIKEEERKKFIDTLNALSLAAEA